MTAHIYGKASNLRNQQQKGLQGIFVGIPKKQKGYLIYVPSTQKIVYSHVVIFDKTFSSVLAYTSCPHIEALATRP